MKNVQIASRVSRGLQAVSMMLRWHFSRANDRYIALDLKVVEEALGQIKLTRYDRAIDVMRAYMVIPGAEDLSDDEVLESVMMSEAGTPIPMREVLDGITAEGFWGFSNDSGQVHYWVSARGVPPSQWIEFLSHEFCHCVIDPILLHNPYADCELIAGAVGMCARKAAQISCYDAPVVRVG